MRCNDVLKLLALYERGELDPLLSLAMTNHLSGCFSCSYALMMLKRKRIIIRTETSVQITIVREVKDEI
ncbi:MAG: zf-HC2 domain-containing protein [Caldisericales bacterium]|nr:zf-HC2 domain-containing protein [Caldisericales bacterium]